MEGSRKVILAMFSVYLSEGGNDALSMYGNLLLLYCGPNLLFALFLKKVLPFIVLFQVVKAEINGIAAKCLPLNEE